MPFLIAASTVWHNRDVCSNGVGGCNLRLAIYFFRLNFERVRLLENLTAKLLFWISLTNGAGFALASLRIEGGEYFHLSYARVLISMTLKEVLIKIGFRKKLSTEA